MARWVERRLETDKLDLYGTGQLMKQGRTSVGVWRWMSDLDVCQHTDIIQQGYSGGGGGGMHMPDNGAYLL